MQCFVSVKSKALTGSDCTYSCFLVVWFRLHNHTGRDAFIARQRQRHMLHCMHFDLIMPTFTGIWMCSSLYPIETFVLSEVSIFYYFKYRTFLNKHPLTFFNGRMSKMQASRYTQTSQSFVFLFRNTTKFS